jgi:hypothetical protein
MIRSGIVLLCVLALAGCGGGNKIPDDIIAREKMEKVLWDMMIADRYSAQFLAKDSASRDVKKETFQLYESVFQTHGIRRDEFIKSFKYYLNRPDLGKIMFDSLAARGNRRRDELYKSQPKNPE